MVMVQERRSTKDSHLGAQPCRLSITESPLLAILDCQVPLAIARATLDMEPRRFILNIPDFPTLDVNLDLSDAEIVSLASSSTSLTLHGASEEAGTESNNILTLKRQRDFDVDNVNAEWKVADSILVVTA
jgi:hypothetical protein